MTLRISAGNLHVNKLTRKQTLFMYSQGSRCFPPYHTNPSNSGGILPFYEIFSRNWLHIKHSSCIFPLTHKYRYRYRYRCNTSVYREVSEWSENCKWYRSLPLGVVVSLFVSQSSEFCRHNLCCFSTTVYCCCLSTLWLSPGNFWILPRTWHVNIM
jgi:hypothetical protein